jgi:hypothetical protein
MKQYTKWFATALAVAGGLIIVSSAQAQTITGTPFLSNIDPDDISPANAWLTSATFTSTPTGLEVAGDQGVGGFGQFFYSIPVGQQTALNPLDTQATIDFTFNSPAGPYVGGVAVVIALDDSMGGVVFYSSGYNNAFSAGTMNSVTFDLLAPNLGNIAAGALINGMSIQLDPGNIGPVPYDVTFNSITLTPAPEPASLALVSLGVASLLVFRRRR